MAVPTYDELLVRCKVDDSVMEQTFDDYHLRGFSLILDKWEQLAIFLGMPTTDIDNIKSQGSVEDQGIRMLERWKQRCGSAATYKAMVQTLLHINRTDLAEKVGETLRVSSIDAHASANTMNHTNESSQIISASPASSSTSGIENVSSPASMFSSANMSPSSQLVSQAVQKKVESQLRELENEFYHLVTLAEVTIKNSEVHLDTIIRRFRMLPQSIRRQHQTDENYKATRQRILNSTTSKELFDNLTDLKHWSYMAPDTLAHILKDVEVDGKQNVNQEIEKYNNKLTAFKTKTKLKDIIGLSFLVPDYCIELTMKAEGWKDKTIDDAEKAAVNILRQATCSSCNRCIRWKEVKKGCIELVFIITESVSLHAHSKERLLRACKDNGIISVQVDGDNVFSDINDHTTSMVWYD